MKEQQQQVSLRNFLSKYQQQLSKKISNKELTCLKAQILSTADISTAAQLIADGHLVAFPTQTVYGLGANALNAQALSNIYSTKKRPLSDPIIVHVLDFEQAEKLVEATPQQNKLFRLLTQHFWPGPLTVILKANLQILPAIVTAQTGFVGIRAPKHPFARQLIEASKVPIGAPSANLFSHVSPTEPVHVFNDFHDCEISIVDGDRCQFGVQSTVVKLVEGEIQVLRQGSLSISKLESFLKEVLPEGERPKIVAHRKVIGHNVNMEAPGQSLKHYAPEQPCFFYSGSKPTPQLRVKGTNSTIKAEETAFISFDKNMFSPSKGIFREYFQAGQNLPFVGSSNEGEEDNEVFCSKEERNLMREVYYLLRECENREVRAIVVGWAGPREGTLWDKILRSTQGLEVENVL